MTDVTILPAGFDLDVLERTGRYAVEAPENGPYPVVTTSSTSSAGTSAV